MVTIIIDNMNVEHAEQETLKTSETEIEVESSYLQLYKNYLFF